MASTQTPLVQKSSIPFYRDERILKIIAQVVSTVVIGVYIFSSDQL